jgi:hypothetical protein
MNKIKFYLCLFERYPDKLNIMVNLIVVKYKYYMLGHFNKTFTILVYFMMMHNQFLKIKSK